MDGTGIGGGQSKHAKLQVLIPGGQRGAPSSTHTVDYQGAFLWHIFVAPRVCLLQGQWMEEGRGVKLDDVCVPEKMPDAKPTLVMQLNSPPPEF